MSKRVLAIILVITSTIGASAHVGSRQPLLRTIISCGAAIDRGACVRLIRVDAGAKPDKAPAERADEESAAKKAWFTHAVDAILEGASSKAEAPAGK